METAEPRDEPAVASAPMPPSAAKMDRGRLEAFSDGVMAIIVTITVFGLKPPADGSLHALVAAWPAVAAYALSFVFVAVIWVNHHHLLQSAREVGTSVLWANLAMLFAMSFIPFSSAYLAEHIRSPLAVAMNGGLFAACLLGFITLSGAIARHRGSEDENARRRDVASARKNIVALVAYLVAVPIAFVSSWTALAIILGVSACYTLPITWPAASKA